MTVAETPKRQAGFNRQCKHREVTQDELDKFVDEHPAAPLHFDGMRYTHPIGKPHYRGIVWNKPVAYKRDGKFYVIEDL